MHRKTVGRATVVALACLVLLPLTASAQSSIVGVVRDESGGVLPGVNVEGASPVLIEKVRTGVTDEQGRYRLVDLRPGIYTVSFTLTGFSTVVREGIGLPANFTATVNADLKVGSLQESVTVSGAAPVVDVQQASKTQVLTRDIVDTLPTSRNIFSMGVIVPGIRLATPDVGGSQSMAQTGMQAHGVTERNVTQLLDGMMINSNETSGSDFAPSLAYWDDALSQEVSVTTSAISAETAAGGVRLNIIPKDGGNIVSGAVFLGGSNGNWLGDNLNDELRARGFTKANGIAHVQNFNGSMGGPIKRDRLWFFASARHTSADLTMANVPKLIILPDGTVVDPTQREYVRDVAARLTLQVNPKNKFGAMFERIFKRQDPGLGLTNASMFGVDPRAATARDSNRGLMGPGEAKWTSTLSSKLLLEGGYSTYWSSYVNGMIASMRFARGTPEWYAHAKTTDTALNKNFYPNGCAFEVGCTTWGAGSSGAREPTHRHVVGASVSYVTGAHNLKVGFQDTFGRDDRSQSLMNGDLIQNYVNNKPQTVTVSNTPYVGPTKINYDVGIYAQDSWTIKRLTLNPGIRVAWFKSGMLAASMPAGRFVPERYFDAQPGIPTWGPYWTPRLSVTYDLFGDGRTALKANYSKYYAPWTGDYVRRYANAVNLTDSRAWFDTDLVPGTSTISGVVLPTNNDGIAQDNEIGPSSSANYGKRSDRNPAPDLQNYYNWETTAAVQHQLLSGVSVTVQYYRRTYGNLQILDRGQIASADYTSFTLPMPDVSNDPTLSGVLNPTEIITVYNLNSAKRSVFSASQVDYNSTGAIGGVGPNQSTYNGVELSFSVRLKQGTVFGGMTTERNVSKFCDYNDDPNGVTMTDLYQTATVSQGGRFCDQGQNGIPWRKEYKVSGTYSLPYSVSFGLTLQSYPGLPRVITWQPAAALFPGGSRTNSETIVLSKPGTLFQPRYNQTDINFKKNFRSGRKTFSVQVDFFNVLNAGSILSTIDAVGSSLGKVTSILQGRLPRLAFQMQW